MMERRRFKERISHMLRESLQSHCSLISSRNVSDVAGEPVFVSRRFYDSQKLHTSLYFPFLSEHSSLQMPSPRPSVDFSLFRRLIGADSKKKKKKERRVSEIGVCYEAGGDWDGRTCPPASPVSPSNCSFEQVINKQQRERLEKKREKKTKKKLLTNSYGFTSSSSSEDSDQDGFFSSDEGRRGKVVLDGEEETETLFSSRSFSSDSSEFYYHSTHQNKKNKKKSQNSRRGNRCSWSCSRRDNLEDGYRPLVSIISPPATSKSKLEKEEEKKPKVRREGFAVVKQSTAPYEDFRSSMMEMIVEKQMLGAKDLEHLLHCYLYLNSPHHHRIILEVFSEICEVLFSN